MLDKIGQYITIMIVMASITEPTVNIIKKYIPVWEQLDKYIKQIIVILVSVLMTYLTIGTSGQFDVWEILIIGIGSSLNARILHDLAEAIRTMKETREKVKKEITL